MDADEQRDATRFLADPATHRANGDVEVIDTHISRIFLAGQHAYKMKRAVKLPYADFSTPQRRLATCVREVELNRATAPQLYLGARRITRAPCGGLEFDGDGDLVEAVVEMRRFDQSALLDRMALAGTLTPALMTETTRTIARFHRSAPVVHADGGAANIAGVLDINRAGFAASDVFAAEAVDRIDAAFRDGLAHHAALLDGREAAGRVRRCHGDLHLRNICVLDGRPHLFDCIEFNDRIATVDVLYDLAFLLMDLWHRGFRDLANQVANRYLDKTDDEDGFVLLPYFMAVRAAVRAHVTATQVVGADDRHGPLLSEARSYFSLAEQLLRRRPPRLVAIGGYSGTGKTTIAEALAAYVGAPPGARIVESDRIRKALHGVAAETRLPDRAYRPEISETVYREMAARTGRILAEGGCVVADAVFDLGPNRSRIAAEAASRGIPFQGVWLEADPSVLRRRVSERRGGPSDATVEVLSRQLQGGIDGMEWRRMDATGAASDIVAVILEDLDAAEVSAERVDRA